MILLRSEVRGAAHFLYFPRGGHSGWVRMFDLAQFYAGCPSWFSPPGRGMTSTKSTPAHDSPEAGFVSPLSLELRIFHLYGECSDNYTIVYYYGKRAFLSLWYTRATFTNCTHMYTALENMLKTGFIFENDSLRTLWGHPLHFSRIHIGYFFPHGAKYIWIALFSLQEEKLIFVFTQVIFEQKQRNWEKENTFSLHCIIQYFYCYTSHGRVFLLAWNNIPKVLFLINAYFTLDLSA